MRRITPLFMIAAILSLPAAAASIALTGVNLIDVEGLTVKSNQTVLLQDDRIAAIQPDSKAIPKHYTKVDLTGKYVLPGLIDAHVHHATEPEGYNNADISQRCYRFKTMFSTSTRRNDKNKGFCLCRKLEQKIQQDLCLNCTHRAVEHLLKVRRKRTMCPSDVCQIQNQYWLQRK